MTAPRSHGRRPIVVTRVCLPKLREAFLLITSFLKVKKLRLNVLSIFIVKEYFYNEVKVNVFYFIFT